MIAVEAPGSAASYDEWLSALRETKLEQTAAKARLGPRDRDDHGDVLPPEGYQFEPPNRNHLSGAFFGAAASGANFRAFLENHPIYVHPKSSLAGAYMDYFAAHRLLTWKPELDYSHLHADQQRYGTIHSIGGSQHEDVILGIQNWIGRSAAHATTLAADEPDPAVRRNLLEIAEMNDWLVAQPPRTFREACEWLAWFQMAASRETTRSSWQSWETVPAARRWRCSRRG